MDKHPLAWLKNRVSLLDIALGVTIAGLYLTSFHSYLLFHTLAEILRVSMAVAIFMLALNVRNSLDNSSLLFISVAYVFVCGLEILHALASQGLGAFPPDEPNLAAQLWIAARYVESASLLLATFVLNRKLKLRSAVAGFSAITVFLLAAIFFWRVFPACIREGNRPTAFLTVSEFLVISFFVASVALLVRHRDRFDRSVSRALVTSLIFSILSELSIALQFGRRGFPFLLGHLLKIVAFYYIYRAVVETGLARPLAVLYRNLKASERAAARLNEELDARVQARTDELSTANERLRLEIDERRRIDEELRGSERKYRIVAENTYDWEWWRDTAGRFIYSSPSCERITQHPAEAFQADPDLLLRIIHPDDLPGFVFHQDTLETGPTSGEVEFRIMRPDGSFLWLSHACLPVFDEKGRPAGRRGSNRDITELKRDAESLRESERRLRRLSSQIMTAQETERRRISRELHDDLGGALAVLKLRTSFIEKSLRPDQAGLREESRQIMEHIDQVIDNVARISRDLSPSILEDLGLVPALRRLIENFSKAHEIEVASDLAGLDAPLSKNAQFMLYRILQEALTNIGKHSRAKNASVVIRQENGRLRVSVDDDGRGFDAGAMDAKRAAEKGMGLATMKERARMLGGTLDISGRAGLGTRITLVIPAGEKEGA
jgi:PAS domain S-box-containing protein